MKYILLIICIVVSLGTAKGQAGKNAGVYTIEADKITAHIEPTMYGIFFEDIRSIFSRCGLVICRILEGELLIANLNEKLNPQNVFYTTLRLFLSYLFRVALF